MYSLTSKRCRLRRKPLKKTVVKKRATCKSRGKVYSLTSKRCRPRKRVKKRVTKAGQLPTSEDCG